MSLEHIQYLHSPNSLHRFIRGQVVLLNHEATGKSLQPALVYRMDEGGNEDVSIESNWQMWGKAFFNEYDGVFLYFGNDNSLLMGTVGAGEQSYKIIGCEPRKLFGCWADGPEKVWQRKERITVSNFDAANGGTLVETAYDMKGRLRIVRVRAKIDEGDVCGDLVVKVMRTKKEEFVYGARFDKQPLEKYNDKGWDVAFRSLYGPDVELLGDEEGGQLIVVISSKDRGENEEQRGLTVPVCFDVDLLRNKLNNMYYAPQSSTMDIIDLIEEHVFLFD